MDGRWFLHLPSPTSTWRQMKEIYLKEEGMKPPFSFAPIFLENQIRMQYKQSISEESSGTSRSGNTDRLLERELKKRGRFGCKEIDHISQKSSSFGRRWLRRMREAGVIRNAGTEKTGKTKRNMYEFIK
jgi:hypothetical protein